MKNILKYLKIIINIFLLLILSINLISIISLKVLKKDYPSIFGYTYFEVSTGSMVPKINIGDIVIVKLDDEIAENDIITYKSDNSYITHRVVKIKDKEIITKGDANNIEDIPISQDRVIGRVIHIEHKLGLLLKIITKKLNLILIVSILIILNILNSYETAKEK